jgi:hypothetical protein
MKEDFGTYYSLRIGVSEENFHKVGKILGIETNQEVTDWWTLEYIEKEEDKYIPFIDRFLAILEGKYDRLEEIGVKREDISVWFIYCYDGQCNMEFDPQDMYNLGKEGIKLCISCYDIHDYDADYDNEEEG